MVLGHEDQAALRDRQRLGPHAGQRQPCFAGQQTHLGEAHADGIGDRVVQSIDHDDFMGQAAVLRLQRGQGLEDAVTVLGADAADQDREQGLRGGRR